MNTKDKRKVAYKKWAEKNQWYLRDRHYFSTYGITFDEYKELLKNQSNRCAICCILKGDLCVDHDHKTHKVRGLLCQKCNRGLGQFEDSVEFLQNAIQYLSKR